ncbi:hypothetical protein PLESTF_001384300 [Pleodorina starrii]|nr:hypothetical protein PLESTF_001384300 [Pleodorina starrii]
MRQTLRQLARPSATAPRWRPTWAQRAPHVPSRWSTPAARAFSTSAPGALPSDIPSATSSMPTTTMATQVQQQPAEEVSVPGPAVPAVAAADELADLPFYSQFPLDRRAEWRRDRKLLDELFAREDATLIPLLRDTVLVRPAPSTTTATTTAPLLQPVLLRPASHHTAAIASSPARVFLGLDARGAPYFAAALASPDAARSLAAAAGAGAEWRAARAAGPDLAPGDASLLAVASGLMVWHGVNGFSATSGAPSAPSPGGYSRRCTAGGGSAYPRIDPAVIMLVSHRGFALLGRKAEWPADRYSTLAGFLEVGEPLEVAVAREVEEEAGVRVDLASVTYAASQPWPFPRSLMIGFHARAAAPPPPPPAAAAGNGAGGAAADGGYSPPPPRPWWQPAAAPAAGFDLLPPAGRRAALDVGLFAEEVGEALGPLQGLAWPSADQEELADVRWFHRDWLQAVFRAPGGAASVPGAGRFNIPGPYSLAYRLITSWAGIRPGGGAAAAAPPPPAAAAPPPATDPWDGDAIPQVLLGGGSGTTSMKYVLARLWDPRVEGDGAGRSKLLVWGDARAPYHNDVLQKAKAMARPMGLQVTPLGGGRIRHDPEARAVQVYGYSAAFGPAPHEVAAALIHRWFPLYDRQSITVSYDGY